MKRAASNLLLRIPLLVVSALSLFSGPARAENPRVTGATDFWFLYEQETTFFARTYAVQGYNSDPMLWLYDANGTLLAANDDYYGLQSRLELVIPAGWYRLRAGVCCGNPDAWYQWVQYDLSTNGIAVEPTTTTVETTTTSTTTTTEPETTTTSTTTTTEPPTTTSSVSSTTVVDTTSVSTTTVQETVPQTVVVTTTTQETVPQTTTTQETVAQTTTTVESTATNPPVEVETSTTLNSVESLPSNQNINVTTTSETVVQKSTTTTPATTTTESLPPLRPVATTTTTTELAPTTTTTTTIPPSVPLSEELNTIASPETTQEEAVAIFASLEVSQLTEQEVAVLVQTLNTASDEVKEAFEQEINVYGGQFDDYVPTGSTVPVGTRRVIVAATGVLFAMPTTSATTTRRK